MAIPVNGTVKIINEYSQLVLKVEGEARTEGTRIEQYTNTGRDHQRWRVDTRGLRGPVRCPNQPHTATDANGVERLW